MAEATYDQTQQDKPTAGAPPSIKPWLSKIQKARKLREQWEKDYKVKKCEEFFLGKQWQNQSSDGPRVMNHFLATIKVTQTNLLFENPKVMIRPKINKGMDIVSNRKASLAEEVLQNIMSQDDNFDDATRLALLQAFFRIGVVKVIYEPELEPNPNAGRGVSEVDSDGNPILDDMGQEQPVVDPTTGQPVMEPPYVVSDDTYRWEWVDAKCLLLPDEGPYQKHWTWIGEEVTVPLQEAREDERFPEELRVLFRSNVKEDKRYADTATSKATDNSDDEYCQLFRYVELYDIRKKRWLVVAEDQDFHEPLIDDVLPEGVEDHPYAILPGWTPILGPDPSPWPVPHTYPWLDIQEEYNIRREQEMQGAKRSARKVAYAEDTFADPEEALKMLQSSQDMQGVKVTDIARLPVVIPDSPVNPDLWRDTSTLLGDWRIVTGQTGAKLSGESDAETATEANFVERASNLRDAELQKAVYKWLRVALKKMLQLVKATLTHKLYAKLRAMSDQEMNQMILSLYGIPPEMMAAFPGLAQYLAVTFGNEKVEQVSREDLTFECDIDIAPGSTRPRSLAQEKAQFLEFLQIFAQFPQLAMSRALLEELQRKYEFLNPMIVNELQMLAMTLVNINANQAGRSGQGGQNTAKENTEGEGNSEGTQKQAQAARGI